MAMAETGRPPFRIDWDVVDKLLQVHCTGTECASNLGVHAQTLYHACEREKGMGFTDYALKMREKGNTILRAAQANKALVDKDNTLLIWLGKVWLGQTDKIIVENSESKTLMDQIKPSTELVHEQ